MVNLQVMAFHIDFSTLDIERGYKTPVPCGINYTIQPIFEGKGLVLGEKEQVQPEEQVSAPKRKKRR